MLKRGCRLDYQEAPRLLDEHGACEVNNNGARTGVGVDSVENAKIVLAVVEVHCPLVLQLWWRDIPLSCCFLLRVIEKLEKSTGDEDKKVVGGVQGFLGDCRLGH